jgi:hypothetical protein
MFEPTLVIKYHKKNDTFSINVKGNFTKGMIYSIIKALLDNNPDICQEILSEVAINLIKKNGMLN